jgi:hypothetical protein
MPIDGSFLDALRVVGVARALSGHGLAFAEFFIQECCSSLVKLIHRIFQKNRILTNKSE